MFHIFDSLPSTNDYCLDYAKNNPNARLVCIAHHQTKGRGRNGKVWDSEQGENLYLSYLRAISRPGPLSLLVGLVLAQLLESLGLENIQVKWPNDVFIHGAKIAGILIEGPVIGIGLNLVPPVMQGAGALSEQGLKVDKLVLAEDLITRLETAISAFEKDGFKPLLADWARFDYLMGHEIAWENGLAKGESRALGINEAGGLILETEPFVLYSGTVRRVHSYS
jgi:BirA family transcriptional regulator, biotin operon repressor / biotin---[acetyl-CoA-carboxylase] ligase